MQRFTTTVNEGGCAGGGGPAAALSVGSCLKARGGSGGDRDDLSSTL